MNGGRAFVAILAAAGSAALLAPAGAGAAKGFEHGVAAGEVTAKSAKVWGQATDNGRVVAKLGTDRRFREVIDRKTIRARGKNDDTVQTTFRGLKPKREHWYQFCVKGGPGCSEKGMFTTPPAPNRAKRIKFAFSGDADGTPAPGESEPFFGNFKTFKAMRRERNDFNVFIGDTIYSDSGVAGPPALTVEEKWAKYAQNLEERHLRKLRRSGPVYSHWDDHEFINDFSIPEDGEALYRAGVRAFTDYAPVGYSERDGLYRSFRWGRNAEVFFLDERSFRDAKADVGGTCDNPDTGSPDLAPTAPPDKRATFSLLIPSLANPVSQACKDAINDPERTLLGSRQFDDFVDHVSDSDARWKIVMNETPIQQFYGLPYDRWEGYAHERVELLNQLEQRGVDDLVFLTTDTHADFANVVRQRTFANDVAPANAPGQPSDTRFWDFIAGPVGTNTFFAEIDDVTGNEGSGELLANAFFKPAPPDGVGMACAQGDAFSYAQVSVGKRSLKLAYRDQDGNPVSDVDGGPCGPFKLTR